MGLAAILLLAGLVQATPQAPPPQLRADSAQSRATLQAPPETRIDRMTREIAQQLRCPVCQGNSLQDSPSTLAQEMRSVIREKLEAGQTPGEIKAYFKSAYGEFILLKPEARGFNLAVYLLPVLAVLFGAVIVFLAARRWLARTAAEAVPAVVVGEEDPDLASWEDIRSS
jgi:cytochrome c-type biogenesis protein CcmH